MITLYYFYQMIYRYNFWQGFIIAVFGTNIWLGYCKVSIFVFSIISVHFNSVPFLRRKVKIIASYRILYLFINLELVFLKSIDVLHPPLCKMILLPHHSSGHYFSILILKHPVVFTLAIIACYLETPCSIHSSHLSYPFHYLSIIILKQPVVFTLTIIAVPSMLC